MRNNHSLRTKYWGLTFLWLFCIYSTLYVVRPIFDFLDERLPVSLLVNVLIVLLLLALVVLFGRQTKVKGFLRGTLLLLVLILYIYGMISIRLPAEKIHFIEYGLLAFLCYRALRLDIKGPWAFGVAFFLTFVFGWIDEGIQYLLPNRYYEFRDVLLNAASALLGLLLTYILRKEDEPMI